MNQLLPATAKRKARRLVLLASVAGLAIAAVAAGPSSFNGSTLPAFTTPALADSVQPSAGIRRYRCKSEAGRDFRPRQD